MRKVIKIVKLRNKFKKQTRKKLKKKFTERSATRISHVGSAPPHCTLRSPKVNTGNQTQIYFDRLFLTRANYRAFNNIENE